jgi:DnaJ like chaperone protein
MAYWGKLFGGMAGFAMGGPFGAVIGAAMGHAADQGRFTAGGGFGPGGFAGANHFHPARLAAMLGQRDQLFALGVVTLSAKLAKCDGPVSRTEIDAFKRNFRIPPEQSHQIGLLFDQARDSVEDFGLYADEMGEAFADNRGLLEDVLASLSGIALADGPLNGAEQAFLARVRRGFQLGDGAWERARSGQHRAGNAGEDPYQILGVSRNAANDDIRAAWKKLMRENHPDSLASRGVPAEFVQAATDKVARINAAWDRVKRERGL